MSTLEVPNEETIKAMRDAEQGKNVKSFSNAEDSLAALGLNKKPLKIYDEDNSGPYVVVEFQQNLKL